MKNLIMLFILLFLVGCSRNDAQTLCVEKASMSVAWKPEAMDMGVRQMANQLIKEVDVVSNKNIAVRMVCDFVDKVITLDIAGLDYDRQRKTMQVISDVCIFKDSIAHKAAWMSGKVELAYDLQIKILRWQLKQIERLRPQKDVIFNEMDVETREKYSKWRDCYVTIVASFEQAIRKIENIELPVVKEIASVEEYERIKMKMEEFLGRDLRKDVFKLDGVLKYEVGPISF